MFKFVVNFFLLVLFFAPKRNTQAEEQRPRGVTEISASIWREIEGDNPLFSDCEECVVIKSQAVNNLILDVRRLVKQIENGLAVQICGAHNNLPEELTVLPESKFPDFFNSLSLDVLNAALYNRIQNNMETTNTQAKVKILYPELPLTLHFLTRAHKAEYLNKIMSAIIRQRREDTNKITRRSLSQEESLLLTRL